MATAATQPADNLIQAIRRFNRFYTRQIGVLHEGLLHSQFSLTEVRVLYELAHSDHPTATELAEELGLDAGYLSRILRGFQARGLVSRSRSDADARQSLLALTSKGRETFAMLDARSNREVGAMLDKLSPEQRSQLVASMQKIEDLLGRTPRRAAPYLLRAHQPGDMGWVVYRHGAIYAGEYGYSEEFEALVAEIAAHFLRNFDSARERCWIAERDGEIVGSIFLVKKSKTVAKLRLLLVEPSARGLGIGKRLISECVRFARQVGYKKITLWTQSELLAARHLYEQAEFRLVASQPHRSFGKDLVAETWELKL
jgi:DNA-binding MarR family transcriptional regulator/N-acetylglutamate synthase-like GNAT family acetyltransferase